VPDAPQRLLVLYDRECGFCAWGLAWLLRFDRARQLQPVAIQSEEGARLLADMPAQERLSSWHACDARGVRHSAGAAFAPVLARLPAGRPLAALAVRFPRATQSLYSWVAAHRNALGRPLSGASKVRARALIATRADCDRTPRAP
jgi:predicted DCC family thiol-disulfide oxidoreductase YuxK